LRQIGVVTFDGPVDSGQKTECHEVESNELLVQSSGLRDTRCGRQHREWHGGLMDPKR